MRFAGRSPFTPRTGVIALSLALLGACTVLPRTFDRAATAPVIDGFGAATLVPARANDAARRLFAQGMAQAYAFNEEEAIRAFKAALAQDPSCGMCAWGVAFQMGPNINQTERGDLAVARTYVDYALAHSRGASARDRALIASLAIRYAGAVPSTVAPPAGPICRSGGARAVNPLDLAYADHMQQLVRRFPDDPDVLTLYAEAALIATPGDWWDTPDDPRLVRIRELAGLIEAALKRHPGHVGLNHYMIHAFHAASDAQRAEGAADALGKLAPNSPHLLHMPSHIYAYLGRYADASRVNQQAVAADVALIADMKRQGFEPTRDWRRHNGEFQMYAALMEGRGQSAIDSARSLAQLVKGDHSYGEFMRSLPLQTLLNLQRFDAVLAEPALSGEHGMSAVMGGMARGIALARSGQLEPARGALVTLEAGATKLTAAHPDDSRGARMIRSMVTSARGQLEAEIAFAEQRVDDALRLQAAAVEAAAFVEKFEPPMFANGPRQRLTGMQLRARRYADAEQSARAELLVHPRNGWAYAGLEAALRGQGKTADAEQARQQKALVWPRADRQLLAMQPGARP